MVGGHENTGWETEKYGIERGHGFLQKQYYMKGGQGQVVASAEGLGVGG